MEKEKVIAKHLLDIGAVVLRPHEPFTWASGWKSPIYCDNRKIISYPQVRDEVCRQFIEVIKIHYPNVSAIAGVATGAIVHAALVANEMQLPMSYVRPKPKEHGLGNQVEGVVEAGQQVVVIEDLISTGGSSLQAVQALRDKGVNVLGMIAIFSYQFPVAIQRFKDEDVQCQTLTSYNQVITLAKESNLIKESDLSILENWQQDPANFSS